MSQAEILLALQNGPKTTQELISLTDTSLKAVSLATKRLEGTGEILQWKEICAHCGQEVRRWRLVRDIKD